MEASARSIEQQDVNVKEIKSRPLIASIILVAGTILLALSMALSISFGAADISLKTVWQAVFQFDGSITHHNVIQELRMPRAIGGVVAGAFLAVSGAIMQGMTRNPLASPSLMGITDGAVFGIAIMYAFFPNSPLFNVCHRIFYWCCVWCEHCIWNWVLFTRWINTCEISFSRCSN